jgi:hypothetical protein
MPDGKGGTPTRPRAGIVDPRRPRTIVSLASRTGSAEAEERLLVDLGGMAHYLRAA